MTEPRKPPAHEAGLFFKSLEDHLKERLKHMPPGPDREFAQETIRGFSTLGGVARNGNDKSVVDFLTDTNRARSAGLPPHTTAAILEHYESFRLGLQTPEEYTAQIKKGMAPDLEAKRALFGGRSAAVAAGEQAGNEQARKLNADVKAQLGGASPAGVAATPPPAQPPKSPKPPAGALPVDAQAALDKQAHAARADLAKLGHTYATPGDGPSVTTIMHGAKKDTRAALDALKVEKPGGLTGILNSLGEMKRPKGGGTAAVIMTGLIGAASLLSHKPAEAAPPKVESTVKEGPATVNKTKPSGP